MAQPPPLFDATGVGTAAVSLFRSGSLYVTTVTLVAGDQAAQDGSDYRVPKKDLVSVTQVMNFRSRATAQTAESQLDWRERANDDHVLALAIATWQAERDPDLGFSYSCGVSEMDWGGI